MMRHNVPKTNSLIPDFCAAFWLDVGGAEKASINEGDADSHRSLANAGCD